MQPRFAFKSALFAIAICLLTGLFGDAALRAQVQIRAGVRAAGMGGAFTAVSNDVNGLLFSPAGLLNSPSRGGLELGHHKLFAGLQDGNMQLNQIGGFWNFQKSDSVHGRLVPRLILPTASGGNGENGESSSNGRKYAPHEPPLDPGTDSLHVYHNRYSAGVYLYNLDFPGLSQNNLVISGAISLWSKKWKNPMTRDDPYLMKYRAEGGNHAPNLISLGLSLRYLHYGFKRSFLLDDSYARSSQDFAEIDQIRQFLGNHALSRGAFTFDANVAIYISHRIQAAVSILNLLEPNLAVKSTDGAGGTAVARLPRRFRAGAAYWVNHKLLAALDVEKNGATDGVYQDYNIYLGAEYLWSQFKRLPIAVRAGVNGNYISAGFGANFSKLVKQNLTLNFVSQLNLHQSMFKNYRISFNYDWR